MEPTRPPKNDPPPKNTDALSDQTKRQIEGLKAAVNSESDDEPDEDEEEESPQRRPRGFLFGGRRREEKKEPETYNEFWYKEPNIQIKVPKPDAELEVLLDALQASREQLETLKRSYCRSKQRRYKDISDAYYHEIKRIVNAVEALKDVLASRGDEYRVYFTDREHPDIACKRIIVDCFVASSLYGCDACETDRLRYFRDVYLARNAFGRRFIRFYYSTLGPRGAALLNDRPTLTRWTRTLLDPIVRRLPHPPAS
ncbi:MAG: CFI-box-CTERM domain-containing protein [Rhodothermales bacterium]